MNGSVSVCMCLSVGLPSPPRVAPALPARLGYTCYNPSGLIACLGLGRVVVRVCVCFRHARAVLLLKTNDIGLLGLLGLLGLYCHGDRVDRTRAFVGSSS